MTSGDVRRRLFDRWAESYDDAVYSGGEFPFAGYDRILDEVVRLADVEPGMRVLDLGTGTGNLAVMFSTSRCTVVGVDFSGEMIAVARRRKFPNVQFVRADITGEMSFLGGARFDRIVSTYVFHEFDLATKLPMIRRLARDCLAKEGRIIIGDIAFPTINEREKAHRKWIAAWDEDEYYWSADEAVAAFAEAALQTKYTQISCCGGVFVIKDACISGGTPVL